MPLNGLSVRDSFSDIQYFIDNSQLIDIGTWQDYVCLFCLCVAENPVVHKTSLQSACKAIFCQACFDEAIQHDQYQKCPLRCSESEYLRDSVETLPVEMPNGRSVQQRDNLLVKCKFEMCDCFVRFSDYSMHIDNCGMNPNVKAICRICLVPIGNHNCAEFVANLVEKTSQLTGHQQDLTAKIENLEKEIDKLNIENIILREIVDEIVSD